MRDMRIVARCRRDQTLRFNVRENKHKPRTGSVSPTRTAFQSWPNCKRLQSLNQPSCQPTNQRRPSLSHFHIEWISRATPAVNSQWEFAPTRAGLFFRLHIYIFWQSAISPTLCIAPLDLPTNLRDSPVTFRKRSRPEPKVTLDHLSRRKTWRHNHWS